MKIELYLASKIISFTVPQKVSGSFNFDEDLEEESKLINIESRESKWFLYSTTDVSVFVDGVQRDSTPLEKNKYYVLKRFGMDYLIFVTNSFDDSFSTYKYNKDMNLIIGNDPSCNINFQCPYFNGVSSKVIIQEGQILLEIPNNFIFLNNVILLPNKNYYLINNGDQLNLFGLKIIFYNGLLLINNPNNLVKCNLESSKLSIFQLTYGDKPKDFVFKDIELYSRDQYFSKAPRIRRSIIPKEIKLSPPPKKEGEEKMPLILTIGPMLTMGVVSGVMLANTIGNIASGNTTIQKSWPSLASSSAMLISMILWPALTKYFNKKLKAMKKKETIEKYTKYLNGKREELLEEQRLQKDILIENLISVDECINIINTGKVNFWDKRIEQNDFLVVRVGRGNELLAATINYPEEGFTIEEDDLKKKADLMVEEFKYIQDVPIGYSLFTGKLTAFMGDINKCYGMINNIILQLITFYSYEDIKIVIFTNNKNQEKWNYLKYLNHSFSNDKQIRFFSSNIDSAKMIGDFLNLEIQKRLQISQETPSLFKPYYVIITDDYSLIKGYNFTKILTEVDMNLGFSLLILEEKMSKLPSKCNNFINIGATSSGILMNSFESQKIVNFIDEIDYSINMMEVTKKLSNIPIELEEGTNQLPESITYLEMEKIGKVEQLNILNRWDQNDSTKSLKAEVGVDENGNLMYLDLHEKFHGPHGLIAGMTGSGKSEFIITYILSMATNYSPNDVSFILIDYKGGGLAFAFENKATGVSLPHLAGIITNLDKSEMDRTLVSIDSEIKRRQKVFNEARDLLGESTIDIYKYQRFFKEGKLKEPVSHLFIVCDEFAELKSQQPDFMDNLISVARIGRALGVHLVLATQKPSGVVNDQIWSNTKFRVCLKVQDVSDSKEMLKRPEAASLKQVGRFYLQVGYDEYFALGQSAWCGAKYYPSEKIIKQVDKSINFIDDFGNTIKSIQSSNNQKIESQGEQLSAILKNIIEVSKLANIKVKKLWLNNIDPIILVDNLEKKYNFEITPYDITAVIGEYDAPEKQEQGILTYSLRKDGNTTIFGNDEIERDKLLNAIIYSICKNHSAKEINIYAVDFGSEQIRMFSELPQVGGLIYMGDDEGVKNLFKLIYEEIKIRKKLLIPFGGSIENFNNKNEQKLPQILFIINNYEGLLEIYNNIFEDISSIGRDCERYGITLLLISGSPSILGRRVSQCFNNSYALHLNDPSDYYSIYNSNLKIKPREILGRGLVNNGDIHEFQTASIVDDNQNINDYIETFIEKIKVTSTVFAKPVPTLPEKVTMKNIEREISTIQKVPIGISKNTLQVIKYDFTSSASTTISSNKLNNINSFMDSLLEVFLRIKNLSIIFIDTMQTLPSAAQKTYENKKVNYFNSNFNETLDKLLEIVKNPDNSKLNILYMFYGLEKLKTKADISKIEELFKEIKARDNFKIIMCDSTSNLRAMDLDLWYAKIKNNTEGIWVGKGFAEQQNFRISKITKEMSEDFKNNYGFCLKENNPELIKFIEFNDLVKEEENTDEE